MRRVNRLLCALAVIAAALLPIAASAYPVPSPGLERVLAAPPTGFTELIQAKFHGRFTAHDYAATYDSKAADAEDAMRRNGFVDGFGVTWVQESTGHTLIEFVIAFEGGNGARSWLAYEEASIKSHMEYQHANSMAGIGPYYGVHLVDPFTQIVIDGFTFVKGNDMFGVGFASAKDDALSLATTQVRSQYDFAPKETIPSAQWAENASKNDFNDLARILAVVLIVALVAGVGTLVVARVRSRPRMSPDGNHWWDGKQWIDSSHAPPPFAKRTADGVYWWDGLSWRPVAQTVQPPTGTQ